MCFFYLIEQHSKFLLHTLQVLYMCTLCDPTNVNSYLKCIVYDKLLKPRQSFRITLYNQRPTMAKMPINATFYIKGSQIAICPVAASCKILGVQLKSGP